ncbi:hypothetical protein LY76DRAFT_404313 [Colletotrichum caudatum]|nr:hypothetical protein LY76DRAFT_404313 [Colletotrichum caudatum]
MIPSRGHPHPLLFQYTISCHPTNTTISDIFLAFVKYASALDFSSPFFLWPFVFVAKCLLTIFLSYGLMDGWQSTRTSL